MSFSARFDDSAERRDTGRRTLQLGVTGTFARGPEAVTVHNISATGLLLETATPLTEGETFVVDLPEAGAQAAEVVWASAPMFGCRFADPLGRAAVSAAQLRAAASEPPAEGSDVDDFGARLHRLRRERGLSLGEIASRLGVSKPTVWAWEHGKSRPVERRLAALAEVLGITASGLEPPPSGPSQEIEDSRQRIAAAYGIQPSRVRIMIEL